MKTGGIGIPLAIAISSTTFNIFRSFTSCDAGLIRIPPSDSATRAPLELIVNNLKANGIPIIKKLTTIAAGIAFGIKTAVSSVMEIVTPRTPITKRKTSQPVRL